MDTEKTFENLLNEALEELRLSRDYAAKAKGDSSGVNGYYREAELHSRVFNSIVELMKVIKR